MRTARANFALNFFGCAGFDIAESEDYAGTDADLIVLCSSDPEYLPFAQEVCAAGQSPGDRRGQSEGPDRRSYRRPACRASSTSSSDAVETLTEWQNRLGVRNCMKPDFSKIEFEPQRSRSGRPRRTTAHRVDDARTAFPSSPATPPTICTRWSTWSTPRASRPSCAARTPRCTPCSPGPSASTRASPPPKNPTPSTAATWRPARRASPSPSTSPPIAATTPTTSAWSATSAKPAWPSTRSRT